MKPVDIKTANECIDSFKNTMIKLGITTPAKGLTTSVGFKSKELIYWLQAVSPHTAELRVVSGVYTAELSPSKVGRFTVFLWPYDADGKPATDGDGNPILPINFGDALP